MRGVDGGETSAVFVADGDVDVGTDAVVVDDDIEVAGDSDVVVDEGDIFMRSGANVMLNARRRCLS